MRCFTVLSFSAFSMTLMIMWQPFCRSPCWLLDGGFLVKFPESRWDLGRKDDGE